MRNTESAMANAMSVRVIEDDIFGFLKTIILMRFPMIPNTQIGVMRKPLKIYVGRSG